LQKKPIPYYLVKEEKSELYLTMEECFDRLNKKYTKEIQKHLMNSNLNTNMIFYQNQKSGNNNTNINQNNMNINNENKNAEKKDIDVNDFFDNKKI
jgi:hypothetical protein